MSKYIDAEKLKKNIERQLSAHDNVDHLEVFEVGKAWNRGHRKALENILSFIDSLQQEQPEVGLENEIDEKWDEFVSSEGEREDFTRIARHFYELGLKAK